MSNNKEILITGINGFLGSHIAKLLKSEYKIIGLEYSLQNLFRIKNETFKIYGANETFENIFKRHNIFAIIHCATVYRRVNEPVKQLLEANLLLPIKLFELSERHKVSVFINTDSFFNDDKNKSTYLSDYTLSKKHCLEWLKLYQSNCKLVNMRIYHMYGPNDSFSKFVPMMLKQLVNNKPNIQLTLGQQSRDFIYIDDVANAYSCVLNNFKNLNNSFSEFEVGSATAVSIENFVKTAKTITKSKSNLEFGAIPYRENEIYYSKADNTKLKKMNWSIKYSIVEGLKEYIEKDEELQKDK